jgi:hypothetical protein
VTAVILGTVEATVKGEPPVRARWTSREDSSNQEPWPAEFAWHVHTALEGWAVKVDVKASILLAFQGGAFIFCATSPVVLQAATQQPIMVAGAGAVLVIAMALAAMAILPALGSTRRHRAEHPNEWIYFGHLRLWETAALTARLAALDEHDELTALCAQLVRMSRINWRKHRLLQVSVLLTLMAMTAMIVAMMPRADNW